MGERILLSLKFIFGFSTTGLLFSGYLALSQLFAGAQTSNEAIQLFLGLPLCWYGVLFYIGVLALAICIFQKRISFERGLIAIAGLSFLGILFAAYLTFVEIPTFLKKGFAADTFEMPTCFMGLVFFMLIFLVAALTWSHDRDHDR